MVVDMNESAYIYGLIDPRDSQVKYIGSTKNAKKRLKAHLEERGVTKKCIWMNQLLALKLKPEMKIIVETTEDKKHFLEKEFIDHYKQFSDLKNSIDATRDTPGTFRTGILRDKDFEIKRLEGLRISIQQGVVQYSINGEKLKEWDCIAHAGRQTGTVPSSISECAHGKRKTANKFIWKLKNTANV